MDIQKIWKTKTARQSSITGISTLINGLLGAAFYFLVARHLGADGYGQFVLSITFIPLVSGIVDIGSSEAIIKFISPDKNTNLYFPAASLALRIKLLMGLLSSLVFIIFPDVLSTVLLDKPSLTALFPWVGVGILSQLLFSFSVFMAQALERFYLWGGLFIGTNLIRLLIFLGLITFNSLSPLTAIVAYVLVPGLGFIFSWLFLDSRIIYAKFDRSLLSKFISFNKWISASTLLSAITSRIDIIFSGRILSLASTGVYSLATQLVMVFPQLITAISAVTTPKFSSFKSDGDSDRYTMKAFLMIFVSGALASLCLVPVAMGVITFVGSEFSGTLVPLLILIFANLIFFMITPFQDSLVYHHSKPKFLFWLNLMTMPIIIIFSLWLIPKFGPNGSALSVLVNGVVAAIVTFYYYVKRN